jgi:hypothetical protein
VLTGSRTRESVPVLVQERIASGETALVMGFVQTNYHTIMREMDRIMSENWSWNLSFTRTSDRSPPSRTRTSARWVSRRNISKEIARRTRNAMAMLFVSGLSRIHVRMTSKDLLAVARHADGSSDYYCVQIKCWTCLQHHIAYKAGSVRRETDIVQNSNGSGMLLGIRDSNPIHWKAAPTMNEV